MFLFNLVSKGLTLRKIIAPMYFSAKIGREASRAASCKFMQSFSFRTRFLGFSLFTYQQVIRFATTCCLLESARGKAKFEDTEAKIRANRREIQGGGGGREKSAPVAIKLINRPTRGKLATWASGLETLHHPRSFVHRCRVSPRSPLLPLSGDDDDDDGIGSPRLKNEYDPASVSARHERET